MAASAEFKAAVGRSALALPAFGFGGAHLGELFATVPERQAMGALEAAWAGGVRYFDTAPWYGHGLSEQRIGRLLQTKPRDEFALSTKVGRVYAPPADRAGYSTAPWAGGLPFQHRFDYGYDGVMRAHEQSLLRLGLNRVEALAIHDLDRGHHGADAVFDAHWRDLEAGGLKALEELKGAGDIAAIGAGINDVAMLERFAGRMDLDYLLVAMPYTLLDQSAARPGGGFEACARAKVSVIIGAPFASGILANPRRHKVYAYAPAATAIQAKALRLQAVCRRHGVTLPAAALQFVLAHPVVVSVIPGAVSARQVRDNLRHLAAPIPPAFWAELRAEGLIEAYAPTPKGPA